MCLSEWCSVIPAHFVFQMIDICMLLVSYWYYLCLCLDNSCVYVSNYYYYHNVCSPPDNVVNYWCIFVSILCAFLVGLCVCGFYVITQFSSPEPTKLTCSILFSEIVCRYDPGQDTLVPDISQNPCPFCKS